MVSCHDPSPDGALRVAGSPTDTPFVALVGQPNVGKSTLFNRLTGSRQHVVNAPRTTVELATGEWTTAGRPVRIADLPGAYSLLARSQDEEVTARAVRGEPRRLDLAIVVADATALSASLYLLGQVAEAGVPVVVALTMADVARSRGDDVDAATLESRLEVPVVVLNPRTGEGIDKLGGAVGRALETKPYVAGVRKAPPLDPDDLEESTRRADQLFDWVASIAPAPREESAPSRSDKVDRFLLKPWIGVPLFLVVLWAVFQLTTTVAGPIQDFFEGLITGPVANAVSWLLALPGWGGGWLERLLVDGLLGGIAVVVSFLPLMAIMFLLIVMLEDSGYLARVAFLADRLMRVMGLDGRAVLPLVIGFGCNLPALAATKTLPNARQRLLTGLLVPFTSCTARLVVYLLIATAFFPRYAGTVVFAMYVGSVALILGVGLVLRRTLFKDVEREPLVLVLPPYQAPRVAPVLRSIAIKCRGFVMDAGKVIVVLAVAVWLLMAIPVSGAWSLGDENMPASDTLFASVSDAVAPVFAPAGFDDWHASAALVSGFAAKEAVVGTLATTYGLDEPDDPTNAGDLGARMRESFETSSGGHGGAAAVAFLVFTLAYTPCLATVAEQRRLFGWRPAVGGVVGSLLLAWILAVIVFQIGALL